MQRLVEGAQILVGNTCKVEAVTMTGKAPGKSPLTAVVARSEKRHSMNVAPIAGSPHAAEVIAPLIRAIDHNSMMAAGFPENLDTTSHRQA